MSDIWICEQYASYVAAKKGDERTREGIRAKTDADVSYQIHRFLSRSRIPQSAKQEAICSLKDKVYKRAWKNIEKEEYKYTFDKLGVARYFRKVAREVIKEYCQNDEWIDGIIYYSKLKDGDIEVTNELMNNLYKHAMKELYKVAPHEGEIERIAQDLVQDTFVVVVEKEFVFDEHINQIYAYYYTILDNLCKSFSRKYGKKVRFLYGKSLSKFEDEGVEVKDEISSHIFEAIDNKIDQQWFMEAIVSTEELFRSRRFHDLSIRIAINILKLKHQSVKELSKEFGFSESSIKRVRVSVIAVLKNFHDDLSGKNKH